MAVSEVFYATKNKGPAFLFGAEPFFFKLATLPLLFDNVSVVPFTVFASHVLKLISR
jgi:hypothetical protein